MELIWRGKHDEQGQRVLPSRQAVPLLVRETLAPNVLFGPLTGTTGSAAGLGNLLVQGDAAVVLASLLPEFAGKVQLAYLDPPFATGAAFYKRAPGRRLAFQDSWPDLDAYLQWLSHVLILVRELLHPAGALFLHLDWRAVHYARVAADEVFGSNFRNCIIWAYGGRGAKAVSGQFPRNHDQILLYARGDDFAYQPVLVEKRTPVSKMGAAGYQKDEDGRPFKTAPRGDYTDESIRRLRAEGRVLDTAGGQRIKYYLRQEGDEIVEPQMLGDVWTDIPDGMHLPAAERTGYPTQKPVRLLQRILQCASKPGDWVLDCCCGSGVTAAACETMTGAAGEPAPRRWILADSSPVAIETTLHRLRSLPLYLPVSVLQPEER